MDSDEQTCATVRAALELTRAGSFVAADLVPLVTHTVGCAHCRERLAPTTIVLSRRALDLAVPRRAGAPPMRGEGEDVFVLFDGSEGDPPRQLTIVVRRAGAAAWDLEVTAEPPLSGVLLVTIGVQNFAGRFRDDGSTTIAGIPEGVLGDHDAPAFEIAIIPYGR